MNILFAFYPLYVTYNHGVALLSSLCKSFEINTQLYILDTPDKFAEYIMNNNIKTVCISCVTDEDYNKSYPFIDIAIRLNIDVLLGGVYFRRKLENDIDNCRICHGEGELLPLYFMYGDMNVFFKIQYWSNLNSLPLPDYEMFKNIPFDRDFVYYRDKKILPYHSSRGCIYSCKFCESRIQKVGIRIRTLVEEDLSYLKEKYNPDMFYLADELPAIYNSPWRESWGNFSHPFITYIRADFKQEWLEWLISRGMKVAMFGVESGDAQYRNEVLGKNIFDDEIWSTIDILERNGVKYSAFFMENTPNERYDQKVKTVKMIDKIRNKGGMTITYNYKSLMEI